MSGMMQAFHTAGRVDAKLVNGMKDIAIASIEVDQHNYRVRFASDFVNIHLCLEEERLHRLIGLQQGSVRLAQYLRDQVVKLAIGQPWRSVSR